PPILAPPAPRPQALRPRDRGAVHGGDVVGVCVALSTAYTTSFGRCRMRHWLPRALWLGAWSFWAWLGWGLYRELPRGLGPVVCKLALEPREKVTGIGGSPPSIITEQNDPSGCVIRARSSTTGVESRRVLVPVPTSQFYSQIAPEGLLLTLYCSR